MKQDYRATGRARGPIGKRLMSAAACAGTLGVALFVASATPASAQDLSTCLMEGNIPYPVCLTGRVWDDVDNDGIQDAGEESIAEVEVRAISSNNEEIIGYTDVDGFYAIGVDPDTYTIYIVTSASTLAGTVASPTNQGGDDTVDSDGIEETSNGRVTSSVPGVTGTEGSFPDNDFGFHTPPQVQQPGTGTPGYWKNHPEAWPVQSITVGGVSYSKTDAIAWLGKVGKDKTTTMFSSLLPAMLNLLIGNAGQCVTAEIAGANAWMLQFGPVGSKVAASSPAWGVGEPLHQKLDAYNNGLLCAPHRN